jgi:hypothetical protein
MAFKNQDFEVILASPPEYERLTAEIFYNGKFIALISQERNEGEFDIETPGIGLDESQILRKIDLADFQDAVVLACRRLNGDVK